MLVMMKMNALLSFVFLLAISTLGTSFRSRLAAKSYKCSHIGSMSLQQDPLDGLSNPSTSGGKFRSDLNKALITTFSVVGLSTLSSLTATAAHAEESNAGKIVVLGSGGKTGKLIVQKLQSQGVPVAATGRTTTNTDVTKIETLESAIKGASAVIFAASASSKGGSAEKVDYIGVENTAKECVRLKVPRLVVISSAAVTRPSSLGFKITNLFGRIMEYKLQGEDALRDAYAADSSLSYAIIRPGGLQDGDALGVSKVEINQGDAVAGEIRRADVAESAIAAAMSKKIPSNTIFEIYNKEGAGPLEGDLPMPTGYERVGGSYDDLFVGMKGGGPVSVQKMTKK